MNAQAYKKTHNSTEQIVAALEELYSSFNFEFFGGELRDDCVITLAGSDDNVLGHHWRERWQNGDPDKKPEININPNYLAIRGVFGVAETMIHEMAHLFNYQQEVAGLQKRDVSNGVYHNKIFKKTAEKAGLKCWNDSRAKQYGYAWTDLEESTLLRVAGLIPVELAEDLGRLSRAPLSTTTVTGVTIGGSSGRGTKGRKGNGSKTKMKKWSCGCTNVRCAIELKATCNECENEFALQ